MQEILFSINKDLILTTDFYLSLEQYSDKLQQSYLSKRKLKLIGAPRQNRTGTPLRERDFESRASTNSARGAL